MSEIDVFDSNNKVNFENCSHQNGHLYWLASDFAVWLGYTNFKSFKYAIDKALQVCTTIQITCTEHFEQIIENNIVVDYKLTRFACYLIAMNADIKKPQVAKAQVYFAALADTLQQRIEEADNVERVLIRKDLTDRNKALNQIAYEREVEDYGLFLNAGYMGMYNMTTSELRKIKNIDNHKKPLFDFMGKRELAANLFRITETEGRIKDDPSIKGQEKLEETARFVGKQVRDVMNVKPEELARETVDEIGIIKKNLKNTNKSLQKLDKIKKKKK